jgi:hypothetical protein
MAKSTTYKSGAYSKNPNNYKKQYVVHAINHQPTQPLTMKRAIEASLMYERLGYARKDVKIININQVEGN